MPAIRKSENIQVMFFGGSNDGFTAEMATAPRYIATPTTVMASLKEAIATDMDLSSIPVDKKRNLYKFTSQRTESGYWKYELQS